MKDLPNANRIAKIILEKAKKSVEIENSLDTTILLVIVESLLYAVSRWLGDNFVRTYLLKPYIKKRLGVLSDEKLLSVLYTETLAQLNDLSQTDINKLKEESELGYNT